MRWYERRTVNEAWRHDRRSYISHVISRNSWWHSAIMASSDDGRRIARQTDWSHNRLMGDAGLCCHRMRRANNNNHPTSPSTAAQLHTITYMRYDTRNVCIALSADVKVGLMYRITAPETGKNNEEKDNRSLAVARQCQPIYRHFEAIYTFLGQ